MKLHFLLLLGNYMNFVNLMMMIDDDDDDDDDDDGWIILRPSSEKSSQFGGQISSENLPGWG